MRTRAQRLLNAVQRPEVYEEVLLESHATPIVLSLWRGEPDAPCVIFLPGTMTHPLFYEEFLDGLSVAGFNVVGVHFRSHGKSPRTKEPFSFEDLVQDGLETVGYAAERFEKVFILGSSQGGIVAMALAARDDRIGAVFAHNVMDPSISESLCITRFPGWLAPIYRVIPEVMNRTARILPRLRVPVGFYLDDRRIFGEECIREQFYGDPLSLDSYALYFLVSLFTADMRFLSSGEIRCPVVVVAATGDELFPFDYTRKVYGCIVAPARRCSCTRSIGT
jgi:pimeloyl-ACP methyl ester carboxylesterase